MATNAQAAAEPQIDPEGVPITCQVYVPANAAAGFAAPKGLDYAADAGPNGYAATAVQPDTFATPLSDSQTWASADTTKVATLAAGAANTLDMLLGFMCTPGLLGGAKVVSLTFAGVNFPTLWYIPVPAAAPIPNLYLALPWPVAATANAAAITLTAAIVGGGTFGGGGTLGLWGFRRAV